MLGSGISFFGYYLLSFVFLIWMVVRIARSSGAMAVLCFFVPALAVFPLLRNWGDPDSDIRIPFFALCLSFGLAIFMGLRAVDQGIDEFALYMSDEEIALIAEENPAMAAQIMAAREAAIARGDALPWDAEDDEDWAYEDDPSGAAPSTRREAPAVERGPRIDPNALPPTTRRARQRAAAPLPDAPEAFQQGPLRQQAGRIGWRFAATEFAPAHATLQVPRSFRFAPRFAISQVARLRGTPLEPVSLGWAVHRDVDLADLDAWYVEALFIESGHMAFPRHAADLAERLAALAGTALLDGSGRSLGSGALAPTWHAEHEVLTWAVLRGDPAADHRADLLAAKPLRHGVLLYVMRELAPEQTELGLRATRLMAMQTEAHPEWSARDFRARRDASAPLELLDWARGTPFPD